MNFFLNSVNDVSELLMSTKEFEEWEVVRVQLTSNLGANLVLNTKVNDASGLFDYQQFKRVKSIVNSFLRENSHLSISLDIKLKMPKTMKIKIDEREEFRSFFVDFYSAGTLSMLTVSELEKTLEASPDIIANWRLYVQNIVSEFKILKGYEV